MPEALVDLHLCRSLSIADAEAGARLSQKHDLRRCGGAGLLSGRGLNFNARTGTDPQSELGALPTAAGKSNGMGVWPIQAVSRWTLLALSGHAANGPDF